MKYNKKRKKKAMETTRKNKCQNCVHCVWLNRWKCDITCWQFDIYLPVECEEFSKRKRL